MADLGLDEISTFIQGKVLKVFFGLRMLTQKKNPVYPDSTTNVIKWRKEDYLGDYQNNIRSVRIDEKNKLLKRTDKN